MSTLLLAILLGIGLAYFAIQNTNSVNIAFAGTVFSGIPLYLLTLGALFAGILISWLFNLADWFSASMKLKARDNQLQETHRNLEDLRHQLSKLEGENTNLRNDVIKLKDRENFLRQQHQTILREQQQQQGPRPEVPVQEMSKEQQPVFLNPNDSKNYVHYAHDVRADIREQDRMEQQQQYDLSDPFRTEYPVKEPSFWDKVKSRIK